MAEPQPSNIQEGASDAPAPTGSAEDRKAAAALSALDAQGDDEAGKKEVDTKAMEKAMKNLGVKEQKGGEAQKKAVKIEAGDVNLLVGLRVRGWGVWKRDVAVDLQLVERADVECRYRSSSCPNRRRPISSGRTTVTC